MTRRPPRRWVILMLGVVVVLGACGGAPRGPASSSQDDGGSTATDAPTAPVPAPTLSVRDDLVDPQVVSWYSWRAVDGRTLEFTVTAGPADCFGASAEVEESDTEVGVRLRVGRLPEAAERQCAAIALASVVPVQLAAPLGTRPVRPLT